MSKEPDGIEAAGLCFLEQADDVVLNIVGKGCAAVRQ